MELLARDKRMPNLAPFFWSFAVTFGVMCFFLDRYLPKNEKVDSE